MPTQKHTSPAALLCAILLGGLLFLRMGSPLPADEADFKLNLLESVPSGEFTAFSDRDEAPTSHTEITLDPKLDVRFHIPDNPQLGYQYAGVTIPLNDLDVSSYNAIKLSANIASGALTTVQLESADGMRENLEIATYQTADAPGASYVVPLSEFNMIRAKDLKHLKQLSLIFSGLKGQISLREISFLKAEIHVNGSPYQKDTRFSFSKGHGAWLYAPSRKLADKIEAYNKDADIPVRYLFVWSGEVRKKPLFDDTNIAFFSKYFEGSPVQLYPMLDGKHSELRKLSPRQIELLARQIAEKYNKDERVAGLQIDIEPYRSDAATFYAAVKKYLDKPLSIALGAWDKDALFICDLPVLMGYDYAGSPKAYARKARLQYGRFAEGCREAGADYLIGLPFTATHLEWSHRITLADNSRENSGHQMEDFLREGLKVIEEHKAEPGFHGISIWAVMDLPTGHREPYQWYPFNISDEQWAMLKAFSF